jgi:hypothetical protein
MRALNLNEFSVDWRANGEPRRIRGDMPLPKSTSAQSAVSQFLATNALELRLNIDPKSLRLVHKVETPTRVVYRYQQFIGDIPIDDSEVIVQTDRKNSVKQLDFGHLADIEIVKSSKAKAIGTKKAYDAGLKSLGKVTLRKVKPNPSLLYFRTDEGLKLAYQVLILTSNPMHDWRLLVDAHSAEILKKEDLIKESPDGSGFVFDPNPVVTANDNTYRQPTATVAGGCGYAGSTSAKIDAQRLTRTLKDLTLAAGIHSLDGPYAKIVNISGPASTIPTEANANDFKYSSSDERLGAVNLYYHIDTIQRYIQGLGITTANNRKTEADPAVTGFAAYYSPGDKSLHMGISRPCHPDKSQEGDAIIHEYGHAIQDNQVPGWGGTNPVTGREEAGAMGEGFGDILACVFFANAGSQFQRETFEDWAFVENGASGLRRVDGTKVYPTDWASEVHDDGEIWSAALWNIYRAIGGDSLVLAERQAARDALLKSLILSHHLLATNASMPDGAEAVMTTNADLEEYRGKHLMEMLNSFHNRGILKCDAAADLWMRDDVTDSGGEPFGGSVFWESPDLWVRKSDDGGTTPQEPELGQDNYFYARVRNRGSAVARAFVVTFNVKPWAGVEFVYPGDFIPFVSAAAGFSLAPGASAIVKAKWPAAMIPGKGTHACLLAQVYMPTDTSPAGSHVWDKNNLAQRNMTVEDAIPGDMVWARFQIGTIHERRPDIYNIELVRPPRWEHLSVSLLAANPAETKRLFRSIEKWTPPLPKQEASPPILKFREYSSVEISTKELASTSLQFNFAPGSSILFHDPKMEETKEVPFERTARLVESVGIQFNEGRVAGFPILLEASAQLKCVLKIVVPEDAKPGETIILRLLQRYSSKRIAGGITIVVNVKEKI